MYSSGLWLKKNYGPFFDNSCLERSKQFHFDYLFSNSPMYPTVKALENIIRSDDFLPFAISEQSYKKKEKVVREKRIPILELSSEGGRLYVDLLSDVYVITCSKFSMFQIFKFIELFEQNVRDSK